MSLLMATEIYNRSVVSVAESYRDNQKEREGGEDGRADDARQRQQHLPNFLSILIYDDCLTCPRQRALLS